MNDSQYRQIVQQEIARSAQSNRFNLTNTTRHQHTSNDIAPISQNDITPGNSVEGSITFAQVNTYKIGVNFNPTSIFVHGNVTGDTSQKFMIVGKAQIGPSFYLQPGTSTSVITSGPRQNIIQSTTYFGLDEFTVPHTVVSEGHIVDVGYGSPFVLKARMTIIGYSNKNLIVQVTTLATSWQMNLSFTIT